MESGSVENQPQIPSQFDRLSALLRGLEEAVDSLSARIEPVSSKFVPLLDDTEQRKHVEELVECAMEISVNCEIVEQVIVRIRDMEKRLEL